MNVEKFWIKYFKIKFSEPIVSLNVHPVVEKVHIFSTNKKVLIGCSYHLLKFLLKKLEDSSSLYLCVIWSLSSEVEWYSLIIKSTFSIFCSKSFFSNTYIFPQYQNCHNDDAICCSSNAVVRATMEIYLLVCTIIVTLLISNINIFNDFY